MRVLVTDDDEMMMVLYRAIFGRFPQVEVKFATSVEECHKATQERKFDLVFMDCDLGSRKVNGLDLLKELKVNDRCKHIFMATTHDDNEFKAKCMKLGADGLIPKGGNFISEVFQTIQTDLVAAA